MLSYCWDLAESSSKLLSGDKDLSRTEYLTLLSHNWYSAESSVTVLTVSVVLMNSFWIDGNECIWMWMNDGNEPVWKLINPFFLSFKTSYMLLQKYEWIHLDVNECNLCIKWIYSHLLLYVLILKIICTSLKIEESSQTYEIPSLEPLQLRAARG